MDLAFKIIHALLAIGLIAGVLLQSGKSGGLSGAIGGSGGGGGSQAYGKAKSMDEKLSKATKYVAILFMISSVVLSFILG